MDTPNPEIAKALEGRSIRKVAAMAQIPFQTLWKQGRRGYLSAETALQVRRAFPDLDLEALITPPDGS